MCQLLRCYYFRKVKETKKYRPPLHMDNSTIPCNLLSSLGYVLFCVCHTLRRSSLEKGSSLSKVTQPSSTEPGGKHTFCQILLHPQHCPELQTS